MSFTARAPGLTWIQLAVASLYHLLFVPLTLGLAPSVAVMQTLWDRGGDGRRSTRARLGFDRKAAVSADGGAHA